MPDGKSVPISKLKSGQSGKVVEISGGKGVTDRLSALGIRPGKRLTKISSMLWRGPVTIQAGGTRVAIGYGMACKILIEPE
ncbi:MAG: ferrous iron transport protein A [Dehalococcoidales bacterium]|nr:ferrous iron transport protein A [Dehalococcoidales bacterium]